MDNIVNLLTVATTEMYAAGLVEFWKGILANWITPIYIAMVAVFALFFIKDRAWMKLIGFVGIAAVVGVLVFAGGDLFGGKNKGLTKTATKLAGDINTVDTTSGIVDLADRF